MADGGRRRAFWLVSLTYALSLLASRSHDFLRGRIIHKNHCLSLSREEIWKKKKKKKKKTLRHHVRDRDESIGENDNLAMLLDRWCALHIFFLFPRDWPWCVAWWWRRPRRVTCKPVLTGLKNFPNFLSSSSSQQTTTALWLRRIASRETSTAGVKRSIQGSLGNNSITTSPPQVKSRSNEASHPRHRVSSGNQQSYRITALANTLRSPPPPNDWIMAAWLCSIKPPSKWKRKEKKEEKISSSTCLIRSNPSGGS